MCELCRMIEKMEQEMDEKQLPVLTPPLVAYERRPMSGDEFVALVSSPAFREAVIGPLRAAGAMPLVEMLGLEPVISQITANVIYAAFDVNKNETLDAIERAAPGFKALAEAGMSPREIGRELRRAAGE